MRCPIVILLIASLALAAGSNAATAPSVSGSVFYAGGPRGAQADPSPVAGVALLVTKRGAVVMRTVTGARGGFVLRLSPGRYVLQPELGVPAHVCGAATVEVRARSTARLRLYCNIR